MKKLFILLTIFLLNCTNTEDKHSKEAGKFYQAFMLIDLYHWVNICPPASRIFEAGIHEISLEKGEALYFDFQTRYASNLDTWDYSYLIGVSKEIPAEEISMNELFFCKENRILSRPPTMKSASYTSFKIHSSDTQFNYYRYYLSKIPSNDVLTVKALNSKLNFKLSIPASGTR